MKKLVTVSLFIFWSVVTAVLVAGLVFYQKNNLNNYPPNNSNSPGQTTGELTLNLEEIATHNSVNNCWLLINNKVYNVRKIDDINNFEVSSLYSIVQTPYM